VPRATILIVDDNRNFSQTLADAFRFADFAVMQASTAAAGLQLASEHRPDLILMDIQLPDLDGLSAAETLKADPVTQQIPIVAMTGHEIEGEQVRAVSRICVGYAQKPVRPRDLLNLVAAVLKLPSPDPSPRQPPSGKAPGR